MGNTDHLVHNIHNILKSYRKVARKRFIDNIYLYAVAQVLIDGSEAPIKLLDPALVVSFSDEQLEEVAGEDELLKQKRAQSIQEIRALDEGI